MLSQVKNSNIGLSIEIKSLTFIFSSLFDCNLTKLGQVIVPIAIFTHENFKVTRWRGLGSRASQML